MTIISVLSDICFICYFYFLLFLVLLFELFIICNVYICTYIFISIYTNMYLIFIYDCFYFDLYKNVISNSEK